MFLAFTCWHKLRKTFSFGKLYFCFALLRLSGIYSSTENLRWPHQFVQSCQNPEDRGSVPFWCPTTFFFDIFVVFGTDQRSRTFSLLCKTSNTWNLPEFGGTSISIELKTVEGTVTKFLATECTVFHKKKKRREKERKWKWKCPAEVSRYCDSLDLTFCEKTKEK